jgi:hypothetical protein
MTANRLARSIADSCVVIHINNTDINTHTMAAPPSIPPMASSDSFNPDFNTSAAPNDDAAPVSPIDDTVAPASPEQRAPPQDTQTQQRVQEVLHSDIGVTTLLNRLKASIASARVRAPSPHLGQSG